MEHTPEFWHLVEQNSEAPLETLLLPVTSLYRITIVNINIKMQTMWKAMEAAVANLLPCSLKFIRN